jgi:hypothetical protein
MTSEMEAVKEPAEKQVVWVAQIGRNNITVHSTEKSARELTRNEEACTIYSCELDGELLEGYHISRPSRRKVPTESEQKLKADKEDELIDRLKNDELIDRLKKERIEAVREVPEGTSLAPTPPKPLSEEEKTARAEYKRTLFTRLGFTESQVDKFREDHEKIKKGQHESVAHTPPKPLSEAEKEKREEFKNTLFDRLG